MVNKLVGLETTVRCKHMGQECIRGNVERYAKSHVRAALIKTARQLLAFTDVELRKEVAGR
tara:strand:+ start:146 stop:328 length:183 start_codon:yes stop_codon:yes gene_type:complete